MRNNGKINVMEEKWDYLIILDACRYDYFEKLHKSYLSGRLEKGISPACCTVEWCKRSFRKRYEDIVYISANPIVNSKVEVKGFSAKKHFSKVIDVWDWGWSQDLGTVHPATVNNAVHLLGDTYPDKRFVIHYLQPHEPYLGRVESAGFPRPKGGTVLTGLRDNPTDDFLEMSIGILAFFAKHFRVFGGRPSWKIRELMHMPPATPMDAVRRRFGDAGLRQAYEDNLKLALKHVARLAKELTGNIIITSDHGELLGERNDYSHRVECIDPLLMEIPWFAVEIQ